MADETSAPAKVTRAPAFKWKGREFKLRRFDPKTLKEAAPGVASSALIYMLQDYMQVAYLGMAALARDIYSRSPEGSREFEQFAKTLGLQVVDANGTPLPIADALQNL